MHPFAIAGPAPAAAEVSGVLALAPTWTVGGAGGSTQRVGEG